MAGETVLAPVSQHKHGEILSLEKNSSRMPNAFENFPTFKNLSKVLSTLILRIDFNIIFRFKKQEDKRKQKVLFSDPRFMRSVL